MDGCPIGRHGGQLGLNKIFAIKPTSRGRLCHLQRFQSRKLVSQFVFLLGAAYVSRQLAMGDDELALIVDNDSHTCKAGFAGDDAPRAVFPTVLGQAKQQLQWAGFAQQPPPLYVGDQALDKKVSFDGTFNLRHPVEHGMVTDWDDMEKVRYMYVHGGKGNLCICFKNGL